MLFAARFISEFRLKMDLILLSLSSNDIEMRNILEEDLAVTSNSEITMHISNNEQQ